MRRARGRTCLPERAAPQPRAGEEPGPPRARQPGQEIVQTRLAVDGADKDQRIGLVHALAKGLVAGGRGVATAVTHPEHGLVGPAFGRRAVQQRPARAIQTAGAAGEQRLSHGQPRSASLAPLCFSREAGRFFRDFPVLQPRHDMQGLQGDAGEALKRHAAERLAHGIRFF